MKFDQRKARVTREQVESWLKNKDNLFVWAIGLNVFRMAYCVSIFQKIDPIEIEGKLIEREIEGIWSDSDTRYIEILKQPTTFAHALGLMTEQPVVFEWVVGVFRVDGEKQLQILSKNKWVPWDQDISGFLLGEFQLRLDIDWETGGLKE